MSEDEKAAEPKPEETAPPNSASPEPEGLGLPIAALVSGLLSICLSFLVVGVLTGFIGIVLAIIRLRNPGGWLRHMAWAGLMLSIAGFILSSIFAITYYSYYREFGESGHESAENPLQDWEGVVAPDFTVTTTEGKKIQLSELKGKRVVVDMWATWCGPCVEEIPHLNKLTEESSDKNLIILGISSEDEQTLKQFSRKKNIKYLVASEDDLPAPYRDVMAYPTAFFIDSKGIIQYVTEGYQDFEDLAKLAKADDFAGAPQASPSSAEGLTEGEKTLTVKLTGSVPLSRPLGICSADWNNDGSEEILVSDEKSTLHVFSTGAQELQSIRIPGKFPMIEASLADTPRVLGYKNWGDEVVAMNVKGERIWSYKSETGVNGAHWGDIDGDGSDEMIIGMNGNGGIHIVSSDGKLIRRIEDIGNVWNQAIIPATQGKPAVIFATEAGGSVRVYDSLGKRVHEMAPLGQYYAEMNAGIVDSEGNIQIIAASDSWIAAFDQMGKIQWRTPATEGSWRSPRFVHADVNQDALSDWIFRATDSELVIASPNGVKLAAMLLPDDTRGLATCTDSKGSVTLALLSENKLQIHRIAERN